MSGAHLPAVTQRRALSSSMLRALLTCYQCLQQPLPSIQALDLTPTQAPQRHFWRRHHSMLSPSFRPNPLLGPPENLLSSMELIQQASLSAVCTCSSLANPSQPLAAAASCPAPSAASLKSPIREAWRSTAGNESRRHGHNWMLPAAAGITALHSMQQASYCNVLYHVNINITRPHKKG